MRPTERADLPEIGDWYTKRDENRPDPTIMPLIGAIEPGVAAGFLYRTDSRLALLEGFVTNPDAPLRSRHRALRAILDWLITYGQKQGLCLIGLCKTPGMVRFTQKRGFKYIGQYSLVNMR